MVEKNEIIKRKAQSWKTKAVILQDRLDRANNTIKEMKKTLSQSTTKSNDAVPSPATDTTKPQIKAEVKAEPEEVSEGSVPNQAPKPISEVEAIPGGSPSGKKEGVDAKEANSTPAKSLKGTPKPEEVKMELDQAQEMEAKGTAEGIKEGEGEPVVNKCGECGEIVNSSLICSCGADYNE